MKISFWVKLTIGILIVVFSLIFMIIYAKNMISNNNGFRRNFIGNIKLLYMDSTSTSARRICGIDSRSVYLNAKDPRIVFSFDYVDKVWDTLGLALPIDNNVIRAYDIFVDSLGGTLFSNNYGIAVSSPFGAIDSTDVITTRFESPVFIRSAILSSQYVVLRAFDSTRKFPVFVKADRFSGETLLIKEIFGKVDDGGFSTDGMFGVENNRNGLVYMQFYRNRFFRLDTNLHVIYEAKTIDTTNNNSILVRKKGLAGEGYISPSVPLKVINGMIWIADGRIFIVSKLQAENEVDFEFENNTVIDVYDYENGEYSGSFYVPHLDQRKLTSFRIVGNKMIVLHINRLAVYDISL